MGTEERILFNELPIDLQKYLSEVIKFRQQLTKESDRGCALYAASYLDVSLEKVLRNKLIGNKKHLDSLFEVNGAISTFSSKINIAYSIGIISKNVLKELHLIRKIRNIFGHSADIINFEHETISKLCNDLQLIAREEVVNLRHKFNTSVSYILGKLDVAMIDEVSLIEKKNIDDFQEIKTKVSEILEQSKEE